MGRRRDPRSIYRISPQQLLLMHASVCAAAPPMPPLVSQPPVNLLHQPPAPDGETGAQRGSPTRSTPQSTMGPSLSLTAQVCWAANWGWGIGEGRGGSSKATPTTSPGAGLNIPGLCAVLLIIRHSFQLLRKISLNLEARQNNLPRSCQHRTQRRGGRLWSVGQMACCPFL